MRRIRETRLTVVLAFVLGLVVATAGTATAAKLITGKQIKDGSISAKDLSKAVRAQLAKTGAAGAPGAQGPAGAKGEAGIQGVPGPVTGDLPSGATLRGNYAIRQPAGALTGEFWTDVSFGLRLPSEPTVHVVALAGAKPAACQGTVYQPQAAPGHLCVYRGGEVGFDEPDVGRIASAANPDSSNSFVNDLIGVTGGFLTFTPTGSGNHLATGSWAVTAP
jgi:hypothetical protein